MPWTVTLFALGATAISGLPPLNGFVSEWLVSLGLLAAVLPSSAVVSEHTPETVLECVVEPAGTALMRIVQVVRRLQHGRVQAYVLYLLVGLGALASLVLLHGSG